MNNSSGVTFLRDSQHFQDNLNADASARINKIQSLCKTSLTELLQNMFDGIDDSFFELANNARTNNEQNLFFEAMREIRIKRKSIESSFELGIDKMFSNETIFTPQKTQSLAPEIDFENLSLINKDDMEEDVAITSMSAKATSSFQGPLLQFQTRVANLFGQAELNKLTLPLNPIQLSRLFAKSCERLEINLKERLIVYKQFDRFVLSNLGYTLDEANHYLIKSGILPDFKPSFIKHKQSAKSSNVTNPNTSLETKNRHIDGSDRASTTNDIFPELQTLLANIRTQHKSSTANHLKINGKEQTQLIQTQDLINLLSAIQESTSIEASNPKVVDIHAHLKQQFKLSPSLKEKEPELKQLDDDLINLVSMLFEFILEDYNLSPSIQVLISRLQIPILKVVIKDSSFFSTNKHPARKLLNSLAKAGIGCSESNNQLQDPVFKKIQDTVNAILNNPKADNSLFETLNAEFEDFMIKEEKKSKLVEQRTREAENGLIKSKSAQKAVDDFLNRITNDLDEELPLIIEDVLRQGWSRVMFLAFLKDDQEHQWLKTCQAAQDLIWCLHPISSQKDRQHWISIAPKLLKTLKNGLLDVSFHSNNLDETITEIRTLLITRFKQNTFNEQNDLTTYVSASKLINKSPNTAVERQLAVNSAALEKLMSDIENLQLGTWFEFNSDSNKKSRCKLSTVIEEADSYIFVNRLGLKSIERSKSELANDMLKKKAIKLEDALLIDRAMNSVTTRLKQKASA